MFYLRAVRAKPSREGYDADRDVKLALFAHDVRSSHIRDSPTELPIADPNTTFRASINVGMLPRLRASTIDLRDAMTTDTTRLVRATTCTVTLHLAIPRRTSTFKPTPVSTRSRPVDEHVHDVPGLQIRTQWL
uniref:Uncharacterized protein n=1 Tax=Schizaphis graminum TaxID=13262 RepID=A0A2S2NPR2_SCHGA